MELLELNLDSIQHVCDYLKLDDLTRLTCSCSSLYGLYPDVEAKQRMRMQKVLADTNSIEYVEKSVNQFRSISARTFGDITTEYVYYYSLVGTLCRSREEYGGGLSVRYIFNSDKTRNKKECLLDGGYPDVKKYRRFRTKIDRRMWYIDDDSDDNDGSVYVHRRRFPAAVTIDVSVNSNGRQSLYLTDGIPLILATNPRRLPPWADKPHVDRTSE